MRRKIPAGWRRVARKAPATCNGCSGTVCPGARHYAHRATEDTACGLACTARVDLVHTWSTARVPGELLDDVRTAALQLRERGCAQSEGLLRDISGIIGPATARGWLRHSAALLSKALGPGQGQPPKGADALLRRAIYVSDNEWAALLARYPELREMKTTHIGRALMGLPVDGFPGLGDRPLIDVRGLGGGAP